MAEVNNKPLLIDRATLSEELIAEYKRLMIELAHPIIMDTAEGFVMLNTSGARVNAWVCAWCHKTPYEDALMTKAELNPDTLELETDSNEVPFILFLDPYESETVALEFHFPCAEKLGIFKKMVPDKNGKKEPLVFTHTMDGNILLENNSLRIPITEAFTICKECFEEPE